MNYFFSDVIEGTNDAGSKARIDIERVLEEMGFLRLTNSNVSRSNNIVKHLKIANGWLKEVQKLKSGDKIVIQFPLAYRTIFFRRVLKALKSKGVSVIFLVHDLDMLRARNFKSKLRVKLEEGNIFRYADKIIVHNSSMTKLLNSKGIPLEKMISLKIFDYLINSNRFSEKINFGRKVIVAGSLRKYKVGYLYKGPKGAEFNLYGAGYEASFSNQSYKGSFPPDDVPFSIEGSYGLIWDGDSLDTCSGSYGEYLKYNNPHKTSLYLASGVPVIIWKEAALAGFVKANNVGITINSLNEIGKVLDSITEKDYFTMRENAIEIGKKLRSGFYTKQAIEKSLG